MNELFGVPVDVLAVVLAALVVVALTIVGLLALRQDDPGEARRPQPRPPPGPNAIIVGGLMLGTMIIGAALGFGDIMASTVRTSVITSLGETDEIVSARSTDAPDIATLGQGTAVRYLDPSRPNRSSRPRAGSPASTVSRPAISEPASVQDIDQPAQRAQRDALRHRPRGDGGFGDHDGRRRRSA